MADKVETTVAVRGSDTDNGFWASVASWCASALTGLGNFVGLGKQVDKLVSKINNGNFPSSTELNALISNAISAATAKGEQALTQLNNKLLTFPAGKSGTTKSFIDQARKRINNEISSQVIKNAKVSAIAANASANANSYAATDSSDEATGQKYKYLDNALKYANEAADAAGSSQKIDIDSIESRVQKDYKGGN